MTAFKMGFAFSVFSVALCQVPATLKVQGIDGTTTTLSATDLARLPQQNVKTTDHGKPVTFGAVVLTDVLAKVALPTGDKFHSTAASYYLTVEGKDGYRAVFAWAELDSSFMDKAVYVVTIRDANPLSDKDGPCELVWTPGEKRERQMGSAVGGTKDQKGRLGRKRNNRRQGCYGSTGDTAKLFGYDECGMVCEEKMRIVEEYTASAWVLLSALTKLRENTGKGIGENFRSALKASKAARGNCVKARLALRDHKTRCEACRTVAASKKV